MPKFISYIRLWVHVNRRLGIAPERIRREVTAAAAGAFVRKHPSEYLSHEPDLATDGAGIGTGIACTVEGVIRLALDSEDFRRRDVHAQERIASLAVKVTEAALAEPLAPMEVQKRVLQPAPARPKSPTPRLGFPTLAGRPTTPDWDLPTFGLIVAMYVHLGRAAGESPERIRADLRQAATAALAAEDPFDFITSPPWTRGFGWSDRVQAPEFLLWCGLHADGHDLPIVDAGPARERILGRVDVAVDGALAEPPCMEIDGEGNLLIDGKESCRLDMSPQPQGFFLEGLWRRS